MYRLLCPLDYCVWPSTATGHIAWLHLAIGVFPGVVDSSLMARDFSAEICIRGYYVYGAVWNAWVGEVPKMSMLKL